MAKIKIIKAREILDSRGNPTVESHLTLDSGESVVASVPSGSSLGKYEAVELRDGEPSRYLGRGVSKAIANVSQVIASRLVGLEVTDQDKIDQTLIKLDGTENKSMLGANAILSVSLAVCKAGALIKKIPVYRYIAEIFGFNFQKFRIPTPLFNLINGGKHGTGNLNFQEFFVIPRQKMNYTQALRAGVEVYQTLKNILIKGKALHCVGDEGGFTPSLLTNLDGLEILKQAVTEAGYKYNNDIHLGLDVAASQFFQGGKYHIRDRTMPLDTHEFVEFYRDLNEQFKLLLIEDPFHEDDWQGWKKIRKDLPNTVIVGDDLLATNVKRIEKAVVEKACNGVVVKPNQIGTVSEAAYVVKYARENKMKTVVAHRSGETNDDFIADFAVGVGSDFIKFGAPARGERVVKYNRLSAIERNL